MIKVSGIDTGNASDAQKFGADFCITFFMRDKEKLARYMDDNVVFENIGRGKSVGWMEFENVFDKAVDIKSTEIEFDHLLSSGTNVSADGRFLINDDRWLSFMFVGELTGQDKDSKFKSIKISVTEAIE